MTTIETFQRNLIAAPGFLDPEGVHHEFVSGVHGQKLDFDAIPDGSELYDEWVSVCTHDINVRNLWLPRFVLGVANGTNRLAHSIAGPLNDFDDGPVDALESVKDPSDDKKLLLPEETMDAIAGEKPDLVVVTEDAGTKGTNSAQVAEQALQAGAKNVSVQITWQRNNTLPRLDELMLKYPKRIWYNSIIKQLLPDFEPDVCRTSPEGLCNQGWQLVERNAQ